jgi:5-enolpyruvylshikimate-3-phosphate synthase
MSFVNIFVLRDLILQVAKLFAVENWRVKETERMRAIVDELTKVNIFLKKFWFC